MKRDALAPTLRRRLKLIARFAAGQSVAQLLTMLAGFVALRTMSVSDFALYSLAFAFTSVLGSLVDAGLTRSIVALVGERTEDSDLIARYVAVARRKRAIVTLILGPLAAALFIILTQDRGWPLHTRTLLVAGILASVWLQGAIAMHGTPLLIRSDLGRFYLPQVEGATGRLAGFGLTAIFGLLTPVAAVYLNVAYFAFLARRLRRSSLHHAPYRRGHYPELARQMNAYLRPLWPGLAFSTAQSHISLFVVAAFGSTQTIGEVAALSRIVSLLLILWALNGVLIEPFLARTPPALLRRRYLIVVALLLLGATLLSVAAALEPSPLLLLLGDQYAHLRTESALIVLSASINYVAVVVWTMNSARRWVFGWQTTLYVALTLATQLTCILVLDLSTTRGAVLFALCTNVALLVAHAVGGVHGLRRHRRTIY